MTDRRPASQPERAHRATTLDVSSVLTSPGPFLLSLLFLLIASLCPAVTQARSLALISPSAQRQSSGLRRMKAELRRRLEARGIQVLPEDLYLATASELGLSRRRAMQRENLSRICDALRIDGVLILGKTRRGRMHRLSAYLFDARGSLRLKRRRHQRRSRPSRRWLRSLARLVDRRLPSSRPPLEEVPDPPIGNVPLVPELAAQRQAPAPLAQRNGMDWQPALALGVESLGTSNLYADLSREMDLAVHPWLDLGLDLNGDWAMGYRGDVRSWMNNKDLLQHKHRLYGAKAWAWGAQAQHSLVLLGEFKGSFNREAFHNLDFLEPRLQASLDMQATDWLLLHLSALAGGRAFLHDGPSSSMDTGLGLGLDLSLPGSWFIGLRARGDLRFYPDSPAQDSDALDLQVEAQLKIGGPLWRAARLHAHLGYRRAIGDSHQVQRILSEAQIRALGDRYLSSGPRAALFVQQQLGETMRLNLGMRFEQNDFAGWPALDEQGQDLGRLRQDRRLGPSIAFGYGWTGQQADSGWLPTDYRLNLEYGFVRQWSNAPMNDVGIHMLSLNMQAAW